MFKTNSFSSYIPRPKPQAPDVVKGSLIRIYDWRTQTSSSATVLDTPFFDAETEIWEITIQFSNGDEHWAWYNSDDDQWISGDQ